MIRGLDYIDKYFENVIYTQPVTNILVIYEKYDSRIDLS